MWYYRRDHRGGPPLGTRVGYPREGFPLGDPLAGPLCRDPVGWTPVVFPLGKLREFRPVIPPFGTPLGGTSGRLPLLGPRVGPP